MYSRSKEDKFGIFSLVSVVVCTVIGTGIFYKNISIFSVAENNWKTVIFAWLLVGFICFCTAFTYSRISIDYQTNSGYCGWLKEIAGEKFSGFTSKIFIFFKLGIAIPCYCFYAASTFIRIFQNNNLLNDGYGKYTTFGIVVSVGLLMLFCIKALNYYKPNEAIKIQKIFFYLKIIPIFIFLLFGIFLIIKNKTYGFFSQTSSILELSSNKNNSSVGNFSISNVIVAAPGIMLAYDGFLNAGFYSKNLENPRKSLPKIYMTSMIIFNILYFLITINLLLNKTGKVYEIFSKENLGNNETISKLVQGSFLFFIFLSAIGLINGYCTTAQPMIQDSFEKDLFYFKKFFLKRFDLKKSVFLFWVLITCFWTFIMILFSFIWNSDAFFDGLTNIPTLFLFFVYGISTFFYFLKKCKKLNWKNMNNSKKIEFLKLFFASWVSFLGWISIVLYQFLYLVIYLPVTNFGGEFKKWNGPWETTGNFKIYNYQSALIMLICLFMLFLIYFLDEYLKKKNRKT